MSTRHLKILAVVAAVLTGAVVLLAVLEDRQEVTLREGSVLLPGFNPEKVFGIYIRSAEKTLSLLRKDERFVLPERWDYPVSSDRINEILVSVAGIRLAEKVTADDRNHEALGVAGEKSGLVIRFFDESGRKMTSILIGRNRPGPTGFYVRLEGEKQVYLSHDLVPRASTSYLDYIRKDIPPGRKSDYAGVTCRNAAGDFAIDIRDGNPVLRDVPRGRRQDSRAVNDMLSGIDQFPVKGVLRRVDFQDLLFDTRLDFYRTDGTVCRIELASGKGGHYARTSALAASSVATPGRGEPPAPAKTGQEALAARDLADAYNRDHGAWIYEVGESYVRAARKSMAGLLE